MGSSKKLEYSKRLTKSISEWYQGGSVTEYRDIDGNINRVIDTFALKECN